MKKWKIKKNLDLFQLLWKTIESRTYPVTFVWVKGHANDHGNIQADLLAEQGSLKK